MKLACNDCPDYNSSECVSCKYINKLIGSPDKGKSKKESLSRDGVIPPLFMRCRDPKEVLYDNAKSIETMKYYLSCPDNHKAVIALYLVGFSKTKIAKITSTNRKTVYRILDVFT